MHVLDPALVVEPVSHLVIGLGLIPVGYALFFLSVRYAARRSPAPVAAEHLVVAYTGHSPVREPVPVPKYAPAWREPERTVTAGSPPWSGQHAITDLPGPETGRSFEKTMARAGEPFFTPSGWRPAQSWNCLMTPPKRPVRPHDHTGVYRVMKASPVPEWARRMLDASDIAAAVASDVAHCRALGWGGAL